MWMGSRIICDFYINILFELLAIFVGLSFLLKRIFIFVILTLFPIIVNSLILILVLVTEIISFLI
jgi:hypothetical protein